MIFVSFIAKLVGLYYDCIHKHPSGAVACWAGRGCAQRDQSSSSSSYVYAHRETFTKWRPSYSGVRPLKDMVAYLHTPMVEPSCARWDWDYKWGRLLLWFYVLTIHCTATQLNLKAPTGPMLSAHGTLFVCITCVFGRRKSITKLETTKNTWKLIEASKTSSFGYSQNANFPLHKSRASIRCLQISSHLLFLLGYVLPSCPTWDISK